MLLCGSSRIVVVLAVLWLLVVVLLHRRIPVVRVCASHACVWSLRLRHGRDRAGAARAAAVVGAKVLVVVEEAQRLVLRQRARDERGRERGEHPRVREHLPCARPLVGHEPAGGLGSGVSEKVSFKSVQACRMRSGS